MTEPLPIMAGRLPIHGRQMLQDALNSRRQNGEASKPEAEKCLACGDGRFAKSTLGENPRNANKNLERPFAARPQLPLSHQTGK
jgi:hypothetical protein